MRESSATEDGLRERRESTMDPNMECAFQGQPAETLLVCLDNIIREPAYREHGRWHAAWPNDASWESERC